jgi:molybdate transport system substrate-binding protein
MRVLNVVICLVLLGSSARLWADAIVVATASNFLATMNALASRFDAQTGHTVTITSGSTAKLYQQIVHGAPFDVLMSADQMHVDRLIEERQAVATSRVTYARGRLVLWAGGKPLTGTPQAILADPRWQRIAIANPAVAPYGVAAMQMFAALSIESRVTARLVYGESIAQAHVMVATGGAQLGVMSLSQLHAADPGTWVSIDDSLYSPILQDAILLNRAARNEAGQSFMTFVQGPEARQIIRSFGYGFDG